MKAILIDEERHLHWTDVPDPTLGKMTALLKLKPLR